VEHGLEKWTSEEPWGPVDSGWLPGGHNQQDECNKLKAATLAITPNSEIQLLPGKAGMWEQSKKDVLGHVEYKYYCKGVIRSGPIWLERQSPACGLWQ
jgi:hypothetical protein